MSTLDELDSLERSALSFDITHVLMNKDREVALVNIERNYISVHDGCKLPYGFSTIYDWVSERAKFTCAKDVWEFFSSIGVNSITDIADTFHCISLSDTFWVKPVKSELTWSKVSPFRVDYSKLVSTYALEGTILPTGKNYLSPDVSTGGSFPHTWNFNNGNIQFIKASSKYTLGGINSGFEPYSEYYASAVAKYLGLNCVDYSIRKHTRRDGKIDVVTICDIFTSEEVGAVSAHKLGLSDYESVIKYANTISGDALNTVLDMFFLDCVLLNTDRHFGNIEFLVNNDSLEVIGVAPIFDNNMALLPRFVEALEVLDVTQYVARDGRSFKLLYNLVSRYKDFKPYISKLKNYTFSRGNTDVKESRIELFNSILQTQLCQLSN